MRNETFLNIITTRNETITHYLPHPLTECISCNEPLSLGIDLTKDLNETRRRRQRGQQFLHHSLCLCYTFHTHTHTQERERESEIKRSTHDLTRCHSAQQVYVTGLNLSLSLSLPVSSLSLSFLCLCLCLYGSVSVSFPLALALFLSVSLSLSLALSCLVSLASLSSFLVSQVSHNLISLLVLCLKLGQIDGAISIDVKQIKQTLACPVCQNTRYICICIYIYSLHL